ncbi:hypothetical protein MUK42_25729 [Musa troglodytarum]|uniref:Uncharacterized protein n=1 Tax=Musa troglodytarum TaxID=320322 RepID=A0A9E7F5P8_9LILI|nr:hypothetical protein MUK42_25729 [Musa troglodytarum]
MFDRLYLVPSQKFKIFTIPNLLGLGKLYNLGFTKKCDGHKVFTKSMFDRFFMYHLKNLKY